MYRNTTRANGKNGKKLIEEKYSSQKVAQDMVELILKSLSINIGTQHSRKPQFI